MQPSGELEVVKHRSGRVELGLSGDDAPVTCRLAIG
jgi:hypothetical protein